MNKVWNSVGIYSKHEGLIINATKARAYNTSGDEVPLSQFKSECIEKHCAQLIPESTAIQPSMSIQPFGGITIGAIMPIHKSGSIDDMFNCGKLDEGLYYFILFVKNFNNFLETFILSNHLYEYFLFLVMSPKLFEHKKGNY
jgi:hypothetical protein